MVGQRRSMAFGDLTPGEIELAKSGDEEAFRLIFNRYCRPIVSFINNLVRNPDLAEELAQETFVRAYRNMGTLREETRFSTWLFGIARNVVFEALRQKKRKERDIGLDEPESLKLEASVVLPETALRDRELKDAIERALGLLDIDKRTVFSLKIFHEKSYEEISAITGHSIGKLKTDLHRARAEMRRQIGPYLA